FHHRGKCACHWRHENSAWLTRSRVTREDSTATYARRAEGHRALGVELRPNSEAVPRILLKELASDTDAPRFRIQASFTNRRQVFRQFARVDQVCSPRIIGNSLAFAACFFVLLLVARAFCQIVLQLMRLFSVAS